jgi:hypothetical protein
LAILRIVTREGAFTYFYPNSKPETVLRDRTQGLTKPILYNFMFVIYGKMPDSGVKDRDLGCWRKLGAERVGMI